MSVTEISPEQMRRINNGELMIVGSKFALTSKGLEVEREEARRAMTAMQKRHARFEARMQAQKENSGKTFLGKLFGRFFK